MTALLMLFCLALLAVHEAAARLGGDDRSIRQRYAVKSRQLETHIITADQLSEFMLTFSYDSDPKQLTKFYIDLVETDGNLQPDSLETVADAMDQWLLTELAKNYTGYHTVKKVKTTFVSQLALDSNLLRRLLARGLQQNIDGSTLETELFITFRNEPSPEVKNVETTVEQVMEDMSGFVTVLIGLATDRNDADLLRVVRASRRNSIATPVGGLAEGEISKDGNTEIGPQLAVAAAVVGAVIVVVAASLFVSKTRSQKSDQTSEMVNVLMDGEEDDIMSYEAALLDSPSSYVPGSRALSPSSYASPSMPSLADQSDSIQSSPSEKGRSVFAYFSNIPNMLNGVKIPGRKKGERKSKAGSGQPSALYEYSDDEEEDVISEDGSGSLENGMSLTSGSADVSTQSPTQPYDAITLDELLVEKYSEDQDVDYVSSIHVDQTPTRNNRTAKDNNPSQQRNRRSLLSGIISSPGFLAHDQQSGQNTSKTTASSPRAKPPLYQSKGTPPQQQAPSTPSYNAGLDTSDIWTSLQFPRNNSRRAESHRSPPPRHQSPSLANDPVDRMSLSPEEYHSDTSSHSSQIIEESRNEKGYQRSGQQRDGNNGDSDLESPPKSPGHAGQESNSKPMLSRLSNFANFFRTNRARSPTRSEKGQNDNESEARSDEWSDDSSQAEASIQSSGSRRPPSHKPPDEIWDQPLFVQDKYAQEKKARLEERQQRRPPSNAPPSEVWNQPLFSDNKHAAEQYARDFKTDSPVKLSPNRDENEDRPPSTHGRSWRERQREPPGHVDNTKTKARPRDIRSLSPQQVKQSSRYVMTEGRPTRRSRSASPDPRRSTRALDRTTLQLDDGINYYISGYISGSSESASSQNMNAAGAPNRTPTRNLRATGLNPRRPMQSESRESSRTEPASSYLSGTSDDESSRQDESGTSLSIDEPPHNLSSGEYADDSMAQEDPDTYAKSKSVLSLSIDEPPQNLSSDDYADDSMSLEEPDASAKPKNKTRFQSVVSAATKAASSVGLSFGGSREPPNEEDDKPDNEDDVTNRRRPRSFWLLKKPSPRANSPRTTPRKSMRSPEPTPDRNERTKRIRQSDETVSSPLTHGGDVPERGSNTVETEEGHQPILHSGDHESFRRDPPTEGEQETPQQRRKHARFSAVDGSTEYQEEVDSAPSPESTENDIPLQRRHHTPYSAVDGSTEYQEEVDSAPSPVPSVQETPPSSRHHARFSGLDGSTEYQAQVGSAPSEEESSPELDYLPGERFHGNYLMKNVKLPFQGKSEKNGKAQVGRHHTQNSAVDGSTDYQAMLQERNHTMTSFEAVSLSDSDVLSPLDSATPRSPETSNITSDGVLGGQFLSSGTSGDDSALGSREGRRLLDDLVWLEKKIARSAPGSPHSPNSSSFADLSRSASSQSQLEKIEVVLNRNDSMSFASLDAYVDSDSTSAGKDKPPPIAIPAISAKDCYAPPGKLRIIIHSTKDGPAIHTVKEGSSLEGHVVPGDVIVAVDDVDTRAFTAEQVMRVMTARSNQERKITVLHVVTESDIPSPTKKQRKS